MSQRSVIPVTPVETTIVVGGTTTTQEPDLEGFRAARERKRVKFSEPVVLLGRAVSVWPAGTRLDPDSGEPYDPTVVATSSGAASAMIQAEFFWKSKQDPEDAGALGRVDTEHPMLIAGSAVASAASGMTHFVARGQQYRIDAVHFDGVTGIDRVLIYGALT